MAAADAALYRAKSEGRNPVCLDTRSPRGGAGITPDASRY
jgi:hypothetical protein